MRSRAIGFVVLVTSAAGGLSACGSGDDTSVAVPVPDAGADVTVSDAKAGDAASDGGLADGASDGGLIDGASPSRLLLSYNSYAGADPSEVVAFDLGSSSVAGRLEYTGAGTTYLGTSAPWLLEQSADVVARLDATKPWVIDASWSVARPPADASNTDPQAVVVNAGTKAYVLPYLRNAISVIDTSTSQDGALPTKSIDLSALVQDGGDGTLEMTAGTYVASQSRVYVLLANINQNTYDTSTGYLHCAGAASPTIIAIDTTTDSLVSLDGGTGAGVPLPGRNPAFGQGAMAYDAATQRLLVLQGGCTSSAPDGGDGPLLGAEVDEFALSTSTTSVLLDLSGQEIPTQLVYVDAQHAFVQVGYGPFTTYAWNPTITTLGAAVPNAPDSFAWDGAGNLLGVTALYDSDSGAVTGYDVVSVKAADGTVTKLSSNPFSLAGGGVTGAQLWPAP
jgi:hypothetical protein